MVDGSRLTLHKKHTHNFLQNWAFHAVPVQPNNTFSTAPLEAHCYPCTNQSTTEYNKLVTLGSLRHLDVAQNSDIHHAHAGLAARHDYGIGSNGVSCSTSPDGAGNIRFISLLLLILRGTHHLRNISSTPYRPLFYRYGFNRHDDKQKIILEMCPEYFLSHIPRYLMPPHSQHCHPQRQQQHVRHWNEQRRTQL
jgi:hypothetical protein